MIVYIHNENLNKGRMTMTRKQVKAEIRQLAKHQGFYGRLLEDLNEAPEEDQNAFYDQFADCKDIVDFIMTIEG